MRTPNQLSLVALLATFIVCSCAKQQKVLSSRSAVLDTTGMVATPVGMVPRSHVHLIPDGDFILNVKGHLYEMNAKTKDTVNDFGIMPPNNVASPNENSATYKTTFSTNPKRTDGPALLPVDTFSSYLAWAQWDLTNDVDYFDTFSTVMVVPNAPGYTQDSQAIFIFEGLESASGNSQAIMQPVLQWGVTAGGGGNYWAVDNWYVGGNGLFVGVTTPIRVNTGQILTGLITGGANGSGYGYYCGFVGITPTFLVMAGEDDGGYSPTAVPEPIAAFEVLEGYTNEGPGLFTRDYPANQYGILMRNISLRLYNGYPTISWSPDSSLIFDYNGENTIVTNNSTQGGGQVNLNWYANNPGAVANLAPSMPLINDSTTLTFFVPDSNVFFYGPAYAPFAITGAPNSTINVTVKAVEQAKRVGIHISYSPVTTTFTINTPGITLSNGSNTINETDGSETTSFVMPASGYVTGLATVVGNQTPGFFTSIGTVSVSY